MPWEKSFELTDAVEKAMQVFWEKGYAQTSISDLTKATGVQRGSLYNAFAGKADLFTKSLLKYDTEYRRATLTELQASYGPKESIQAMFDGVVDDSIQEDVRCRGCLLVNTALELQSHNAEVKKIVTRAFQEFEEFFEDAIERGKAANEIPIHIDSEETARGLVALVVGLRVLVRGTWNEAALRALSNQALLMLR